MDGEKGSLTLVVILVVGVEDSLGCVAGDLEMRDSVRWVIAAVLGCVVGDLEMPDSAR